MPNITRKVMQIASTLYTQLATNLAESVRVMKLEITERVRPHVLSLFHMYHSEDKLMLRDDQGCFSLLLLDWPRILHENHRLFEIYSIAVISLYSTFHNSLLPSEMSQSYICCMCTQFKISIYKKILSTKKGLKYSPSAEVQLVFISFISESILRSAFLQRAIAVAEFVPLFEHHHELGYYKLTRQLSKAFGQRNGYLISRKKL